MFSAGSRPGTLHPAAIDALQEIGIDISHQRSKGLDSVPLADADYVVTLCAEEECPVAFTRGRRLAWPQPDPAAASDVPEAFRAARDTLARRIEQFWREAPEADH